MLHSMIDVARRAARLASRVCLATLERGSGAPGSMSKGALGPVTIADYGSQAVILSEVASVFPDHRILAEEGSEHLAEHADDHGVQVITEIVGSVLDAPVTFDDVCRWIDHPGGDAEYTWAVDPIDGTKGFLRGDQFAVAIGILREGIPIAGVLACPRYAVGGDTGLLFSAGPDLGSTVEPITGGSPIRVGVSPVEDHGAIRVLGSVEAAHGDPELVRAMIDRGGLGGGMVRLDSQVKYAAVAAGEAEIYLRPRSRPDYRENVWDHAAGVAVVEHAGGRVTDLDGRVLDFRHGRRLEENRGVLATNGAVHDLMLDVLSELLAT
jgi:3'(2'), 5'-bisphosphate nucleotidase